MISRWLFFGMMQRLTMNSMHGILMYDLHHELDAWNSDVSLPSTAFERISNRLDDEDFNPPISECHKDISTPPTRCGAYNKVASLMQAPSHKTEDALTFLWFDLLWIILQDWEKSWQQGAGGGGGGAGMLVMTKVETMRMIPRTIYHMWHTLCEIWIAVKNIQFQMCFRTEQRRQDGSWPVV